MNQRSPFPVHPRRSSKAAALVIVLAILILVFGIAIGFLSLVGTERTASNSYASSVSARLLADTAVNLAQAQIHQASTQGAAVPWASQPGMVRTLNSDGTLRNAYKLYSDSSMIVDGPALNPTSLTPPSNWLDQRGVYTDLNAPVFSARSNGLEYPILDPGVAGDGLTADEIHGFDITSAPGAATNLAPMPVKWLYVLADGKLVASTASGNTGEVTVDGATKSNPIVGRVAFWTDDETCKLNINTAAHGNVWDLPRTFSFEDRDRMIRFQPTQFEFQRYPGHPATTSLLPVFGHLFGVTETSLANQYDPADPNVRQFSNFVYGIIPRIGSGGSDGGTVKAASTPTLDSDRLYSSIDELIFNANRDKSTVIERTDLEKMKFFLTASNRSPEVNLFHLPRVSIWPINQNAGALAPSTLDKLIAFASTINNVPYYFQRANAVDPSSDYSDIPSNKHLYAYLQNLTGRAVPALGNRSFTEKWGAQENDQILTEILDYIRSTNLYSTTRGATAFTPGNMADLGTRIGQVTPLSIGQTKGFGRMPVLSKAILHFFVSGAEKTGDPTVRFVPPHGVTPKRSADFWGAPATSSYGKLAAFLNTVGEDNEIDLLTSAILYFDTFDPGYGYIFPRYNFDLDVTFSGVWQVNGQPMNMPTSTIQVRRDLFSIYNAKTDAYQYYWYGRTLGGNQGPHWIMQNFNSLRGNDPRAITPAVYPLVSDRMKLHVPIKLIDPENDNNPKLPNNSDYATGQVMHFSGGQVNVDLKVDGKVVQSYRFEFPGFDKRPPLYANDRTPVGSTFPLERHRQFANSSDFRNRWVNQQGIHRGNTTTTDPDPSVVNTHDYMDLTLPQFNDVIVSLESAHGDKRLLAARSSLTTDTGYTTGDIPANGASFVPHEFYSSPTEPAAFSYRVDPFNGEHRSFPGPQWSKPGRILPIIYGQNAMPDIPSRWHSGVQVRDTSGGGATFTPDFDNGTYHIPDDAFMNRADEGSATDKLTGSGSTTTGTFGTDSAWFRDYVDLGSALFNDATFYSPNKQMPSAVMFGSLPTGVVRDYPWQTLLFRPNAGTHPGGVAPPDYAMLDLFWMPVVEPYAISEPFSTAGKVNMNYQILPFTYLTRKTAMEGVLRTVEIVSIADADAMAGTVWAAKPGYAQGGLNNTRGDEYKSYAIGNAGTSNWWSKKTYRKKVNPTETLKGFDEKFDNGEIFIMEAQVCSLPLIPYGSSYSANFESTYWADKRLTGDNSREMPYAQLLPRLTTKSNTYTVHFRVQSVKQGPRANDGEYGVWKEDKDSVAGEYRGSTTIERFINPNNTSIPSYAENPVATPDLDSFYRWRVLNNRQFSP